MLTWQPHCLGCLACHALYVPPRRMELYPELSDNLSNAAVDGIGIQSGMTEPKSEEKLETWEEPGVKVFQELHQTVANSQLGAFIKSCICPLLSCISRMCCDCGPFICVWLGIDRHYSMIPFSSENKRYSKPNKNTPQHIQAPLHQPPPHLNRGV